MAVPLLTALTDRIEREAMAYIERIDALGGMVQAIELGFPQKEIADAAYVYQQQLDALQAGGTVGLAGSHRAADARRLLSLRAVRSALREGRNACEGEENQPQRGDSAVAPRCKPSLASTAQTDPALG